ncbi:MAG: hypothetical protein L6404_02245 [Candidatus Omnitrophica bacterium]|nr:hypothetical protein [Candidatus Omnitrophota bacterium]
MKVAFLCEGHSEYDSLVKAIPRSGCNNFEFLSTWDSVPILQPDRVYIYRHNYKGVGKIRKEYLNFSKKLIDEAGYEKVFIWFDNESLLPVCDYARRQRELIGGRYIDKMELLISVQDLENWYLSNNDILGRLLNQVIDETYLTSRGVPNFLTEDNVDILNAKSILYRLKINTEVECYPKAKLACRFFSLVDTNLDFSSTLLVFKFFLKSFRFDVVKLSSKFLVL